ncbi:MAG: fructose-6-phosphate aldolase [Candidatus Micrarchaeia archaeon]
MKFFLDTANVEKIREAAALGVIEGVTTNPTLIMQEGRDHKTVIQEIAKIIRGPISVEGAEDSCDNIVRDALEFAKWAPNVVVKVPMDVEGIKAVRVLEKRNIRTNVTLVFSPSQALLAAKAGASYVSPFIGRLDDISADGVQLVRDIVQVFRNYPFKTEVIVASIRHPMHVVEAAKAGAHIATIPPGVLEKMWRHPLTDRGIKQFQEDYKKALEKAKK